MPGTEKKIKFDSLLAADRFVTSSWWPKSAQAQSDDTQFENDFSNLAFTFIQDRAPALMSYILGFETVDRSDDGTKAVGIFGFKIDDDYYYVPAFFLNNQVKGIESILSKRTNSFIPLTEEWVNFIINRKATQLGESVDEKNSDEFENPTFEFLQHPTAGNGLTGPYMKQGESKDAPSWNGGLKYFGVEKRAGAEVPWNLSEAWAVMRYRVVEGLQKDEEFRKAAAGLHGAFVGNHSIFKSASAKSPVHDYLSKFGGPVAAKCLVDGIRTNVKLANAVFEFYSDPVEIAPEKYDKSCHAVKMAQEAIVAANPPILFTDKASDEDSARDVLEDGFTVVDKRDDEHSSTTISRDYEKMFGNPDTPGVYDVLCQGGSKHEAYVLSVDGASKNGYAVYFPDIGKLIMAGASSVVVVGDRKKTSKAIYDDASDLGSMSRNHSYLIVGPNGVTLGKFRLDGSRHEKDSRVVLDGYLDSYLPYNRDKGLTSTSQYAEDSWTPSPTRFEIGEFVGSPKRHGSTLVIPSNWKAIEVKSESPECYDCCECCCDSGSGVEETEEERKKREEKANERRRELASLDDLDFELRKSAAYTLDVRSGSDGFEYRFDGHAYSVPMTYKRASVDLVTRLGLRYPEAKKLLKSAEKSGEAHCIVKMGQFVGVTPGMPPDQSAGVDPYTGVPMYATPYQTATQMPFEGVDQIPPGNIQGENLGGDTSMSQEAQFDPEAAELANNAAQSGQKDVFDKAAIGGLAKVYDTGAVIDSYLPEFMQAIDRLGRVMFLYYWKHDDFVERYGTDTIVEMEDVLRSTFKQLGKLTLDLRNKAAGQGDAGAI